MVTPNPDSLVNQRKIRKGTRSCWECKRRKTRCIFPASGESTCVYCQRRRIPCIGQEIPESLALAGKGQRGLGDRITKIEDVMKDLLTGKDIGSTSQDQDALEVDTSDLTPSSVRALPAPAKTLEEHSLPSALLASESPALTDRTEAEITTSRSLWEAFPADIGIRILFQESQRTSRYTFSVNTQPHSKLNLETLGAPYLSAKFPDRETQPVILARCMLIFAITLQAPCEEFLGLSESPSVLGRRWVRAAVSWLTTQQDTDGTVDSLVCIIFEAVFETNCGNLRKAWVIYRRAMTMAQMMGLHRSPLPPLKRIDPALDADPEFMWFRIVYMDRYLSLLLGLPQGATDKSIGAPSVLRHEPPLGRFERQLTVMASCILERNERAFTASEIFTIQSIDAELLRASENMPASFWRPANFHNVTVGSPDNLLEALRLAAQVYYYGLLIQLHLPYMMMHGSGSIETEHEYSKITCINASREIITRFIAHRSFQPKSSCSRPVDFFALLAAMTLVLAHLDARYHQNATNFLAHQRLSDRAMLDQALDRMDAMRDDNNDVLMEDSGKLIRHLLDIDADAASGSTLPQELEDMNITYKMALQRKEDTENCIYLSHISEPSRSLVRDLSLEPCQTPQTELPYMESTENSPFLGDILAPGQLNDRIQIPGDEEQQCLRQNTTLQQSHLDLPDITAGVHDWAFQGADGAFFDSLLRGYSGLDK